MCIKQQASPPCSKHHCKGSGGGLWILQAQRLRPQLLRVLEADDANVNGVVPHPSLPMLVSYGIDSNAKIFSAAPQHWADVGQDTKTCEDVVERNLVLINRSNRWASSL